MMKWLVPYLLISLFTQHHYDFTVFYYSVLLMLMGVSPYDVNSTAPWIYSNPVTYPQWYAYPPFGLIALSVPSFLLYELGLLNMMTFRIILKIILLLSAFWIAKRLEEVRKGSGLVFIKNPLVFFVTAVHGMIDVLAAALLLEALYKLNGKGRYWWAFFALAITTKQTTWIVIPALVGLALRLRLYKDLIKGFALAALIVVPFISQGFIDNVLTFHGSRPPASLGYTGIPLITVAGDLATFHIANLVAPCFGKPVPRSGWGSLVLTAALASAMIYSFIISYRGRFARSLVISSFAFILFSKVVSPQNLLVPLVIFMILGVPSSFMYLMGLLATLVDAFLGTAYSVLGYLPEDALNELGTSIVILYRSSLWLSNLSGFVGLFALVLYHLIIVTILFYILRERIGIRRFALLYVIYLILVLNSVTIGGNVQRVAGVHGELVNARGAVVWIWLNPFNGFRSGDYARLPGATAYWEYTYPLALQTVKWLKDHGFSYVVFPFTLDRYRLYEYVPWLFALVSERMPFAWLVVISDDVEEYLSGHASAPPGTNVTEVLNEAFRATPYYLNMKILETSKRLNDIFKEANASRAVNVIWKEMRCPISYLRDERGLPVIFLIDKTHSGKVLSNGTRYAVVHPKNVVFINDYYEGNVVYGTPITPVSKVGLEEWLLQYAKKSSLYSLLCASR
ncbi:hypothetical protein [Ignicoccus hospitalis]|uniref:hypothetical protein n=1 Tax=Ignicoccus hospitalis TaxID=160233 RepID=UPI000695FD42|nr:hypothetical protein [Ignicoccus hospitalis]HIH90659.1 hypothetical protein [Desulfurococcaceae archaeon]